MISVLIPIYNYCVVDLVNEIHEQLIAVNHDFEIICLDDNSDNEIISTNSSIIKLSNTFYKKSNKNNGIAVTRQLLCNQAKFDWIILIDADIELKNEKFIYNYLQIIEKDFDFVFGGFDYKSDIPKIDSVLRWKYGKQCEALSSEKRNINPYKVTIAANMLAKKEAYKKLNLDSIRSLYAMDYYFGALLKKNNAKVLHIDNQVYHLGIEKSNIYLKKKELAVVTLLKLYNEKKITKHSNDLLKSFVYCKKSRLNYLFSIFYKFFNSTMKKNLTGKNPIIKILQLYKLSYMCYLDLNKS